MHWEFKAINENLTFVTIINDQFKQTGAALTAQLLDATQGFTFVLAGLKAFLEHNIQLKLVDDKFPEELRLEMK